MRLRIGVLLFLTLMVGGLLYEAQCQKKGQEVDQKEAARREEVMDKALRADDAVSISGERLQAFEAVYAQFKRRADVTATQKRLDYYRVDIGEDTQNYYVYFIAPAPPMKRDKEGRTILSLDGLNPNGIGIVYFVRRKDYKVWYDLLNH